VDEPGDHAWSGQPLQVHARLAEALAERAHGPDRELPPYQGVQVDPPGDQVTPGLGGGELRAVRERQSIERLGLDEGQVIAAQSIRPRREGTGLGRVAIAPTAPFP
jgi:hypothetical protein